MRQYEMCEIACKGAVPTGSEAAVDVTATITGPNGSKTVKGFYAGNEEYKVRFFPDAAGTYAYEVKGVVTDAGEVQVEKADAGKHGRVIPVEQHFAYEDGSAYYPFGTTVYALAHQTPELTEETFATLKESPFNKVRMCVFPKHYNYNHNEPEYYAFEKDGEGNWDVNHPCMAFWDSFEKKMARLDDMGIQVDLILFHPYDRWGFATLSQKDNLTYLDYLLRRFSAIPNVWWSLANEYDLCVPDKTLENWEEIEEYVAANDPYQHLLSNHNCFKFWDFTRKNVSHVCIQSKALWNLPAWYTTYKKPLVIDECCYEGDLPEYWGSISGREMTRKFWKTVTAGGYCTHGETFLDPSVNPDDAVVWWAKGGKLQGSSPARIQFLKDIVYGLPGILEPVEDQMAQMTNYSEEELEKTLEQVPERLRGIVKGIFRMNKEEMKDWKISEQTWQGHCGEKLFLYYYDLRCCSTDTLQLPETHTYKVEVIDTWEMTRKTILTGARGATRITLPGKEDMAVLVTAED